MCCPTSPVHGEVEELRGLLETSAILDDDFDDEEEDYEEEDEAAGHYVCEDCDGCHATNEYLLECLNHVLQKVFASYCCTIMVEHFIHSVVRRKWNGRNGWIWQSLPRCRLQPLSFH